MFNGIGAVLLLILFMLMIMTAIAQQEVVNRIKADQLELGYSAALSIRDQVAGRQKELDRLGQEERIGNRRHANSLCRVIYGAAVEQAPHDFLLDRAPSFAFKEKVDLDDLSTAQAYPLHAGHSASRRVRDEVIKRHGFIAIDAGW